MSGFFLKNSKWTNGNQKWNWKSSSESVGGWLKTGHKIVFFQIFRFKFLLMDLITENWRKLTISWRLVLISLWFKTPSKIIALNCSLFSIQLSCSSWTISMDMESYTVGNRYFEQDRNSLPLWMLELLAFE